MTNDHAMSIEPFFHRATGTLTYLVHDSNRAMIIDSVADLDAASGRLRHTSCDAIVARVQALDLEVDWVLETHAHADHLSGGDYLRRCLGATLGIGRGIASVQSTFEPVFNMAGDNPVREPAFDRLFDDGDQFAVGSLQVRVLATPGHTADSVTYLVGDAAFVGDTLFSPGRGTARCDFPGGDAAQLYRTIQTLYGLPSETRLFLCHDYPDEGEDPVVSARVEQQRRENVHLTADTSMEQFVQLREERDATLSMPALILPALQVNVRGGALPPPADNGTVYLKLPINRL